MMQQQIFFMHLCLVLPMVPNSQFRSRSGSDLEPDGFNGSYHTKTCTVEFGPLLLPKTRPFNLTTFSPMKYLSSDQIVTWSIGKLNRIRRSFTSHIQICVPSNFCWVTIEYLWISHEIWFHFTAIQPILVAAQIWMREVTELLTPHNLWIDHVMIRSQLKNSFATKALPKL